MYLENDWTQKSNSNIKATNIFRFLQSWETKPRATLKKKKKKRGKTTHIIFEKKTFFFLDKFENVRKPIHWWICLIVFRLYRFSMSPLQRRTFVATSCGQGADLEHGCFYPTTMLWTQPTQASFVMIINGNYVSGVSVRTTTGPHPPINGYTNLIFGLKHAVRPVQCPATTIRHCRRPGVASPTAGWGVRYGLYDLWVIRSSGLWCAGVHAYDGHVLKTKIKRSARKRRVPHTHCCANAKRLSHAFACVFSFFFFFPRNPITNDVRHLRLKGWFGWK